MSLGDAYTDRIVLDSRSGGGIISTGIPEDEGPSVGAIARTATHIALAVVPYGGVAGALLNWVFEEPLRRRRDAWLRQLAEGLERLERELNIELDRLRENDRWLTLALEASRSAVVTHSEPKREALRNFLLNSAVHPNPDEDEEQTLLALIARLTPSHLGVLTRRMDGVVRPMLYDPVSGDAVDKGNLEFVAHLSTELLALGLLERNGPNTVQVTYMGMALIEAIRDPFEQSR